MGLCRLSADQPPIDPVRATAGISLAALFFVPLILQHQAVPKTQERDFGTQ